MSQRCNAAHHVVQHSATSCTVPQDRDAAGMARGHLRRVKHVAWGAVQEDSRMVTGRANVLHSQNGMAIPRTAQAWGFLDSLLLRWDNGVATEVRARAVDRLLLWHRAASADDELHPGGEAEWRN